MVRALDVQQILLQSSILERVQQVQQHQSDVQQRHFEAQLAENRRALREKVKDLGKSERLMIREEERDKREKNRGENRAKIKKEDVDDMANNLSADNPVRRIDIKV